MEVKNIWPLLFLFLAPMGFLSACSDEEKSSKNTSNDSEKPKAHVKFEWIEKSEENPEGLLLAELEDVEFRVPWEIYSPVRKRNYGFNLSFWWDIKSKELIPIRERLSDYEYGVTLQFRAYGGVHNPRLSYEDEINPDFSKPPISSSIRINGYKLRPSKEYPGLEEYYIKEENRDINYYFVEYEERESSQLIKEKIACLPGFREREKILSPMNGQCHFAQIFSPHTRVVVRFDSHILPQIKEFHQQIFTLISQFSEADQH